MPRSLADGGFCPNRIIEDVGNGFMLGFGLGSIFQFARGMWIYPRKEKLSGAIMTVKRRMPVFAAHLGLWCGYYGAFQCLFLYGTGHDNHITELGAAFFSGAIMDIRSGLKIATRRGLSTAVFIGIMGIGEQMYTKYQLSTMLEGRHEEMIMQEQMELRRLKGSNPQFQNVSVMPDVEFKSLYHRVQLRRQQGGMQ